MPNPLNALLALPVIDRTRRNHGLEHATITLLSQRQRGLSMVGRSTPNGFYLYGDVSTEALAEAAAAALARMRAGEHHLAVHPNCGTNFVTAGLAAAGSLGITWALDDYDGNGVLLGSVSFTGVTADSGSVDNPAGT